jgi:hypothetical protein
MKRIKISTSLLLFALFSFNTSFAQFGDLKDKLLKVGASQGLNFLV